jgi:Ring finger domain
LSTKGFVFSSIAIIGSIACIALATAGIITAIGLSVCCLLGVVSIYMSNTLSNDIEKERVLKTIVKQIENDIHRYEDIKIRLDQCIKGGGSEIGKVILALENLQLAESCSICTEQIDKLNSNFIDLQCSHNFHHHCLMEWLKQQRTCPDCR